MKLAQVIEANSRRDEILGEVRLGHDLIKTEKNCDGEGEILMRFALRSVVLQPAEDLILIQYILL